MGAEPLMHRVAYFGVLLVAVSVVTTAAAGGDERADVDKTPIAPPTIGDLLERIERLEVDKVQMQDEIDELRAESDDPWLSEQRARHIRLLVDDVLADADTRSSLLQDGSTAGWDGKFFLASPDGRFRLNVGGQLQLRGIWNYHDQGPKYRYGFDLARAKLVFSGHVFGPDLTFRIQGDFGDFAGDSGTDNLEDAWIRYMLNNEWALRFGQFRLPFNREEIVDSRYQQVIERSLVNESQNIGRSQGIELMYAGRNDTVAVAFSDGGEDNIGGFNLIGVNPPLSPTVGTALNTDYAVTVRYQHKIAGTWDQFRQFTSPPGDPFAMLLGVAGHYQRNNPATSSGARDETRWFKATTDLSVQWGGSNLFAAMTYDYVDLVGLNVNVFGVVLQGGTYLTEKFEAYARIEWGRLIIDSEKFNDDVIVLTIGGNYYLDGQDVKFSADIGFGLNPVSNVWDSDIAGYRIDADNVRPQVVVRTQFQLLF